MYAGMETASGDCAVIMDADIQRPPAESLSRERLESVCGPGR